MLGRKQWVNIPGAPSTATLSVHTPLKFEAISLGLSLEELILMYNVQFPVLQQNEEPTTVPVESLSSCLAFFT